MSPKGKNDIKWISNVLEANFRFARKSRKGKMCLAEISELMNDVIDAIPKMPKDANEITRSAKSVFVATNLMPMSFGIYVDFLSGNIPVCFTQLRMMIETMAVYFVADKEHKSETFFYDKVALSAESYHSRNVSLSAIIESVDRDAAKLWHRSSLWMHARDLARKFVEQVAEYGVPTWGLVLPMEYTRVDEPIIDELRSELAVFRRVLGRVMREWE